MISESMRREFIVDARQPYAFTEHGAIMADHDTHILALVQAIKELLKPTPPHK
jgi:hypothetical protein